MQGADSSTRLDAGKVKADMAVSILGTPFTVC
jgi:hypothetical protein